MFRGFRFDHGAFHDSFLEKGDFKYLVLDLLKEKPRYGYEVIRALEERFMGFYTPSAGAVYPTLQLFEDMGYVTVSAIDGKKIYTVTEEGKAFLTQRQDAVDRIREQVKQWWGAGGRDQLHDTLHDLTDLVHLIRHQARRVDGEKQRQIRQVVARALQDVGEILRA